MALTIDGSEPATDTEIGRRAPRITAEDVFQAADALLLDGHRPTIDRVRMKLGRGSPNTINEHLDTWWSKLGARLRDLPGQALPGVPEPVATSLLNLWNVAVREAQQELRTTLEEREATLAAATADLDRHAGEVRQQEQAHLARAAGLEDSLALAREQLSATNRRADALEATLRERDAELTRGREQRAAVDAEIKTLRTQLDTDRDLHRRERTQSEARHAAAEARWLQEVDRARQGAKEREKQWKELRAQLHAAQADTARLTQALTEARAELKATARIQEQLERRRRPPDRRRAGKAHRSKSTPRRTTRRDES